MMATTAGPSQRGPSRRDDKTRPVLRPPGTVMRLGRIGSFHQTRLSFMRSLLRRIAREGLAQVLNIKLVKSGVADALEIVEVARASGLGLMIGGMVETRIAMGFSAHLAAGLGGFDWIDLDTPLLLAEDPVRALAEFWEEA